MPKQPDLGFKTSTKDKGPVECLGQTFESDVARREHYLGLLAEKLKDPEFRKTPGFPHGADEAILRMSDPPYYTACPNPFLEEFVKAHGNQFNPNEAYLREPLAVDVSEGKNDQLFQAHSYHTKVPYLAIVPSILHYTNPGDLVFDGFSGSGMTGLAAQYCESAPSSYRSKTERVWTSEGRGVPSWGPRRVVLNDLGPSASFIAAGFNLSFDVNDFEKKALSLLEETWSELGWMYETAHKDGSCCQINYTVWSEVFSCPDCGGPVNFYAEALNVSTGHARDVFPCPLCGAELTKKRLERRYETRIDPVLGKPTKHIALVPVEINYKAGSKTFTKAPDQHDLALLERIACLPCPENLPSTSFPIDEMYHGSRLAPKGISCVHHLFPPRSAHALSLLWSKASSILPSSQRRMLLWFVEQAISSMSMLNRYKPLQHGRLGGSQVNNQMSGIYYVPSLIPECAPWYVLHDKAKKSTKLKRIVSSFGKFERSSGNAVISTGDCASSGLPDDSIDYVFTDPPFGENIFYADLNFVAEAWHGVTTDTGPEAIVDRAKNKNTYEYQDLMRRCFEEYHRVLKPGRWMTVVFSNSKNHIWRAIQEAIGTAGFVVADVRTLDKKQGSYRQVTSSAVKQDLVISAYKPTEVLSEQFKLGASGADSVWSFITEHLRNVPVFVGKSGEADVIAERTQQMLHDRMIAFFVQRGVAVPVSGPEFLSGLHARFPERDGMYFLPGQVTEYDRKRTAVGKLRQLSLFVSDEASAIQWIRQQLHDKPQSFQDLQPQFMQQLQSWAKHEKTIELKEILELNFFCYDGNGPVPSQIHRYLSTNFRAFRNLEKDDTGLKAKAVDRWYVPDPNKEGDLDKLRLRTLLKEFEEYRNSTARKIKEFRSEAVRAGFKHCYDERDYQTIVDVAAKLPEQVIQEDEKLLMYYDVATMRLGV